MISLLVYIIFLGTGICAVRAAIPVQCAMSSNKVFEAGNWPDTVGTYHNDLNWTELGYYRLRCEILNSNPYWNVRLFKVYHDHWTRPFEKEDCERAGCIPVIWNSNSSSLSGQPIIDVYWSNVIQFATTAPQLKICEINTTNSSTIFTTSQLNNMNVCQPSGRISQLESNDNSSIVVKDFFMHVSSDMFSVQEIEQVNNGENVLVTIDKDCSAGYRFRDGCNIMILASPLSFCEIYIPIQHYTFRPHRGLEVTKISDNKNRVIAYKYRLTAYTFYGITYSNLIEGKFVIHQKQVYKPVDFELRCRDRGLFKMLSRSYRRRIVKRFTVRTLYWPNLTYHVEEGVEIYQEHWENFNFPSNHKVLINVTIVSFNEVTNFKVIHFDGQDLKEGEVIVTPAVYDRHNHITMYSIIFTRHNIGSHASYKIVYRVRTIDVELFRGLYVTRRREIEIAINPMKIVVMRGDRSAQPFFTCVATSFPVGVTVKWTREFGTMKAKQAPIGGQLFSNHIQGAYLQFPPATDLTTDYNGVYTCTVTQMHYTKKLSAIFVVLEPGSYYGLYYNQWVPVNPGPGDIVVTKEEKALFSCISQPVIVESGKLSCPQAGKDETFVETMIIISITVLALAAVLLITILTYRWYWKRNQIPVDVSSSQDNLLDVTTSSNVTTTDSASDSEEGVNQRNNNWDITMP